MIVRDNPDIRSRAQLAELIHEAFPKAKPYSEALFRILSGAVEVDETGSATDWAGLYERLENEPTDQPPKDAPQATDRQIPYVPRSGGSPFGTLTPTTVGNGTHAALDVLVAKHGSIDRFVAERLNMAEDKLRSVMSADQIDGVALAIDQIENGGALVIGDETGIGKGRQAAALIRYAQFQSKIPVFFTKDPKLFTDMHGDLRDIDTRVKPFILGDPAKASIVDEDGNVLVKAPSLPQQRDAIQRIGEEGFFKAGFDAIFATYSQINTRNARQLFLEGLAKDNDIILILDEAHESAGEGDESMQAAFMTGGQLKRGKGSELRTFYVPGMLNASGTKQGRGGVLYLSATYAKRPDNMPLYVRTDLRKASRSFEMIVDAMKAGGVALQQAVSEALARGGQYIRRERDFSGINYNLKKVVVKDEARLIAQVDSTTNALREIVAFSQAFRGAVQASGGGRGTAMTVAQIDATDFAAIVHNQIAQLLLAAKADEVIREAIRARDAGEKPVITLMNTMESFLDHYVEDKGIKPGDAITLSWRELLLHALNRTLRITTKLPNGDTTISVGNPHELGVGALFDRIRESINELEIGFPTSPIDYIVQRLQQAGLAIGELTGRESGVEYSDFAKGTGTYRRFKKANKNALVSGFNSGKFDALLLNASGAVGLSIHAAPKFKDSRKRHMIIAQPSLDINTFVQTLGRIKRTGMLPGSAEYTHLMLPLQAEMRPAAVTNRKMKSLNANTTADSKGAVDLEVVDMLNKYGDEVVAEFLESDLNLAIDVGITVDTDQAGVPKATTDLAKKFMGRMALLPNQQQADVYGVIIPAYNELIEQLKATGDYDLDIVVHDDWDGVLSSDTEIQAGTDESSIFTASVRAQRWEITDNRPVPTGEQMMQEFNKNTGGVQKFRDTWATFRRDVDKGFVDRIATAERRLAEAQAAQAASGSGGFGVTLAQNDLNFIRIASVTWDGTRDELDRIFQLAGQVVDLSLIATQEQWSGMLIDVRFPNLAKGLRVSPSRFQLKFLVNAPGGRMFIAGSKFSQYVQTPSSKQLKDLGSGKKDSRYQRWVVTGNPIAAYRATGGQGKMVRFKTRAGDIVTGLLMRQSWSLNNLASDPRLTLATSAAAARFLQNQTGYGPGIGIEIQPRGVSIRRNNRGEWEITTPASTRGRDFFLDRTLRRFMGDFSKSGSKMVARIPLAALEQVIERVSTIAKENFTASSTPSTAADARRLVEQANRPRRGAGPSTLGTPAEDIRIEPSRPGAGETPLDLTAPRAHEWADLDEDAATQVDRQRLETFERSINRKRATSGRGPVRFQLVGLDPRGGESSPAGERAGRARVDFAEAARRLSRAFNKRIIFFRASEPIDAVGLSSPQFANTILVNVDAAQPMQAIIGHELAHNLKAHSPTWWKAIRDAVPPMPDNYRDFKVSQGYTAAAALDEWVSDMVGERFDEPEFWQAFRAALDRKTGKTPYAANVSQAREAAEWITGWLNRLALRLKKLFARTHRFVTDMEALQARMAEVLADYAEASSSLPENPEAARVSDEDLTAARPGAIDSGARPSQNQLREEATRYVEENGTPAEKRDEAIDSIAGVLRVAHAETLEGDAYGSGPRSGRPIGAGGPAGAVSRAAEEALKGEPSAEKLAAAFAHGDRISSIIPALVRDPSRGWDIRGAVVKTARDLATLVQALRSPYVETMKVAFLNDASEVIHSEILSIGSVNAAHASPTMVARAIQNIAGKTGARRRVIISHNHPSGDPAPSNADLRLTRAMNDTLTAIGFELIDHVITNGENFYSLREFGMMPGETVKAGRAKPKGVGADLAERRELGEKAPWEVVKRGELIHLSGEPAGQALFNALKQVDPTAAYLVFVNQKHFVMGLERVTGFKPEAHQELMRRLFEGVGREGATGFLFVMPEGFPEDQQRRTLYRLREFAKTMDIAFLDASLPMLGTTTARTAGLVEEAGAIETQASTPGTEYSLFPDSLRALGLDVDRIPYDVRAQADVAQEAKDYIKTHGEADAESAALDRTSELKGDVRVGIIGELIARRAAELKDASPEAAAPLVAEMNRLVGAAQPFLATEAGQQVSMFQHIYKDPRTAATMQYVKDRQERQRRGMGEETGEAIDEAEPALDKALVEAVKTMRENLPQVLRPVKVSKAIWQRYRDDAAARILKLVSDRAKVPPEQAPLAEFTGRVLDVIRARMEAAMPKKPEAPAPTLTPAQILREAMDNKDKYADVLATIRKTFAAEYGEGSPQMDLIDAALGDMGLRPYSQKLLDRAIREAHAAMKVKVSELARQHATKTDAHAEDLAKALVAKAGLTGADAQRVAADIDSRTRELVAQARTRALDILKRRHDTPKARKALDAIGRATQLNNLGAFTKADMGEVVAKALRLPKVDPAELQRIAALADKVETAPNQSARARASLDLLNALRIAQGISKTDVATAVWYANLLSGYTTQLANTGGNVMNGVLQLGTVALANPRHMGQALRGYIEGFGEGWTQAKALVATGRGSREFDAKTGTAAPILELVDYTREFPSLPTVLAKGLNLHAKALRYVFRFMKAVDALFYYPAREAYARVVATKLLQGQYEGAELHRKVREMLAIAPDQFVAARRQAEGEGYTGIEQALRVANIIEEKRRESDVGRQAAKESERFALESTYNVEPEGWAGVLYQHLNRLTNDFRPGGAPVLKAFLPFLRIPTNLFNVSMNYTPLGAVRALRGVVKPSLVGNRVEVGRREFTPDERNRLLIQALGGSLSMAALAGLALGSGGDDEEPTFDITATGPTDYRARQQLEATGWKPHSIKFGEVWISYRDSPLLTPLAVVGNVVDAVRYQKSKDDATLGNQTLDAVLRAPRVIFDTSMLSGLGQLFDFLQDRSSANRLTQFLTRTPTTVVVPNLLAQIDRTFNPEAREAEGPLGAAGAAVPFVRNTGSVKTDVFGEPVERAPLERFISMETNDPVREVLRDKNVFISVPNKSTKVGRRVMEPAEYRDYVRISGERIRQRLTGYVPMLRRMTPEQAERLVDRITQQERDRAKALVARGAYRAAAGQ